MLLHSFEQLLSHIAPQVLSFKYSAPCRNERSSFYKTLFHDDKPKTARRNVINNAVRLDIEDDLPLAKVRCFRYLGGTFRNRLS